MIIADLKSHLNIEHDDDDTILALYLEAATDIIAAFVPLIHQDCAPVKAAILITAADLYAFRESVSPDSVNALPVNAIDLIAPYRVHSF